MANILQKNWQDLIKPSKLQVVPGRDKVRFATLWPSRSSAVSA